MTQQIKVSLKTVCIVATLLCFWTIGILYRDNGYFVAFLNSYHLSITEHKTNISGKEKVILFWNPMSELKVDSINQRKCFVDKCKMTSERSELERSDAVIFSIDERIVLPKKPYGQVWVFRAMESPDNCHYSLKNGKNAFNWTMTYRRDSDILNMYGGFRPFNGSKGNYTELLKQKSRHVLWFASNCYTAGGKERLSFVKKLQDIFQVDIIGSCGTDSCPRSDKDCKRRLLNETYRFYMSFENSLCKDYVTEKVFDVMNHLIVPIIRNGINMTIFLPYRSYIDVLDFKQSSFLGYFLHKLSSNDGEYGEYFKWRANFETKSPLPDAWCLLCHRLYNQNKYRRLYRDVDDWWRGHEGNSRKMCKSKLKPSDPDSDISKLYFAGAL